MLELLLVGVISCVIRYQHQSVRLVLDKTELLKLSKQETYDRLPVKTTIKIQKFQKSLMKL